MSTPAPGIQSHARCVARLALARLRGRKEKQDIVVRGLPLRRDGNVLHNAKQASKVRATTANPFKAPFPLPHSVLLLLTEYSVLRTTTGSNYGTYMKE